MSHIINYINVIRLLSLRLVGDLYNAKCCRWSLMLFLETWLMNVFYLIVFVPFLLDLSECPCLGVGQGEGGRGPSILEQVDCCFDPVSFPAINSHYVCNYICWVDFIVLE